MLTCPFLWPADSFDEPTPNVLPICVLLAQAPFNTRVLSVERRLQMLDHFAECIKQAKGIRQQAVQLNIFTAVLSALKVSQDRTPAPASLPSGERPQHTVITQMTHLQL